jgi:hypothetical protein
MHNDAPDQGCQTLEMDAVAKDELGVFVEEDGVVVIAGSKEGLLALATALIRFAESSEPGAHVHADPFVALQSDSAPVIVEHAGASEPAFEN